ncbi:MAG TPA: YciI-like protein [Ignavibacteriaceae bacterium]
MNYYALIYHLADDYMTRRGKFREAHLDLAKELNRKNELILAGAFSDPPDKALLIFKVADKSVIEDFVNNDPYVKNGLIAKWEIRPWTVVIGS